MTKHEDLEELAAMLESDNYEWCDVIHLCEIVSRKYQYELTLAEADFLDNLVKERDYLNHLEEE